MIMGKNIELTLDLSIRYFFKVMPFVIRKSGKKWKLVNEETGRVLGVHSSYVKARAQQKAVYVHAKPSEKK